MNIETLRSESQEKTKPIEPIVIDYKEFLKTGTAENGEVISMVKPRDLFTYQTWIDDKKISNVLDYIERQDPELNNITGYLHFHPKFGRNVVVVGNGTHRSLYAMSRGGRVNVSIGPSPVEHTENPLRITNLVKKYGNPFINL